MLVPEGETKEFLGQEFLTWLWYQGEVNEWTIYFAEADRVTYAMDELLTLEPEDPTSCRHKLSGPVPVNSPEAQIGLKEGKKATMARIILGYQEREWTVTCHGENFQFSSLKLMKPTTADAEQRFVELAEDLEEAMSLFDRIYELFLKIRLTSAWEEKELPAIRRWITDKQILSANSG